MKITRAKIYRVDIGGRRPVLLQLFTDEGCTGLGEAAVAYGVGNTAAAGMIQDLVEALVLGKDPFHIEAIWHDMYDHTFWAKGGGSIVFPTTGFPGNRTFGLEEFHQPPPLDKAKLKINPPAQIPMTGQGPSWKDIRIKIVVKIPPPMKGAGKGRLKAKTRSATVLFSGSTMRVSMRAEAAMPHMMPKSPIAHSNQFLGYIFGPNQKVTHTSNTATTTMRIVKGRK
jgi:hypothetical protein